MLLRQPDMDLDQFEYSCDLATDCEAGEDIRTCALEGHG